MDQVAIFSYTRAQAIDDGVLVDITETARKVGILYPVAVTDTVWQMINNLPNKSSDSPEARLWDIVSMLRFAIGRARSTNVSQIYFKVVLPQAGTRTKIVMFKSVVSGGDDGEPVITVMLPQED